MRTQKPLTGRAVLGYLLAFFAVVGGANLALVKFAVDTLPGTEVDSAYRASLGFNAEVNAAREQARRSWRVAAHVERDADSRASVRIEARDAANAPVSGVTFFARLARPTDKRADHKVALAERGGGVYRGEAADVAPGQWDLIIEADRGAERVFLSRNRVVLR
jgi:nitrogen fixation protein FixH